jgi:integrase/recombinase XerD
MAQAKTLSKDELERVLDHIDCNRYALRNRAMMQLTHLAGLRIGEVACLRWSDVIDHAGKVKEEIRLLPAMTKGRHARTVFVSLKLREELQAHADSARCIDRSYPFFASQKSIKSGFSANSLAQTFALIYDAAGVEGASSHSGRRSFFKNAGWASQHQYHSCLPVQQSCSVTGGSGVGLIYSSNPTWTAKIICTNLLMAT